MAFKSLGAQSAIKKLKLRKKLYELNRIEALLKL